MTAPAWVVAVFTIGGTTGLGLALGLLAREARMTRALDSISTNDDDQETAVNTLKIEPAPVRTVPSDEYLAVLRDLGASDEVIAIARGERRYRFCIWRKVGAA